MDAVVILPDHLHCIWQLPKNDDNFSSRWRLIKSHFSRTINSKEYISKSRQRKKERGIWQRRFWEHVIRNEEDYIHNVEYIHYNPVKHGYVNNVKDWKYSSFHHLVGCATRFTVTHQNNDIFKDICYYVAKWCCTLSYD